MSKRQRHVFCLLVIVWFALLASFYYWWFDWDHINGTIKFICNTFLLTWTLVFPGYFLFFVGRMKQANPLDLPNDWRVAMITTRAPSEPFEIVRQTLEAMLDQSYIHDTILADENPSETTRQWCQEHGVKLITRKGVPEYHQKNWPRRTRCKEGNLAYFYDLIGYDQYDYVVQMDADHKPEIGYLEQMLKPFLDPTIGYVSAPSICDNNLKSSWSARGRLYSESIMHGPLQAGYSNGFAPLCIGSHYGVRTKALREIGGLGPELAEDHSTTLMMNSYGWRGAHAIDAIAHGDGPANLADCITQEFQWSRSLVRILLTLFPKYWNKLPLQLKLQFALTQLWYPLFGATMLCALMIPALAVLSQEPWVSVNYIKFILHALPPVSMVFIILAFIKRQDWLRPSSAPLISWETILFQAVRWPWAIYGSLMGLYGGTAEFKVTPKGTNDAPLPWYALWPYLLIVTLAFTSSMAEHTTTFGYYLFLVLTQIIYVIVLFSIILLHSYEITKKYDRHFILQMSVAGLTALLPVISLV